MVTAERPRPHHRTRTHGLETRDRKLPDERLVSPNSPLASEKHLSHYVLELGEVLGDKKRAVKDAEFALDYISSLGRDEIQNEVSQNAVKELLTRQKIEAQRRIDLQLDSPWHIDVTTQRVIKRDIDEKEIQMRILEDSLMHAFPEEELGSIFDDFESVSSKIVMKTVLTLKEIEAQKRRETGRKKNNIPSQDTNSTPLVQNSIVKLSA